MNIQHKNEKVVMCSIPRMDDLCALSVKVKEDASRHSHSSAIHNTSYSHTVISCRKLIFMDNLVLASPMAADENAFVAIVPKSHLVDHRFKNLLGNLDLEVANQRRSLDPALLETCLKYTIATKLAPAWNKAGNVLIEGCRFLEERGRQNAVELNVNVRDDEACLCLSFSHVTLAELKLEELVHSHTKAVEFMGMKVDCLDENYFVKRWCHVLPSMKKGEIGLVTRNIPPGGLFRDYGEMKIYWKNMYGYILPESEQEHLYFHVFFRMLGNNPFIYPSCCMQLHQPLKVPHAPQKAEEYLVRFLKDLQMHIPQICGDQWLARTSIYKPTLSLQSASCLAGHYRSETQSSLIEKIQSKEVINVSSRETMSTTSSRKESQEIAKYHTEKLNAMGSSEKSTSEACFKRLNLSRSFEHGQITPYVPSFGVAAAFGRCQQPKLKLTTGGFPFKQTAAVRMTNNSPFGAKLVPGQREIMKISKVELSKSSQVAAKTSDISTRKKVNVCLKTNDGKPKKFNDDIVLLANENKLSKASNVSLLRWLKEMGVPCSTKTRKAELINKVTKFLEISAPEQ